LVDDARRPDSHGHTVFRRRHYGAHEFGLPEYRRCTYSWLGRVLLGTPYGLCGGGISGLLCGVHSPFAVGTRTLSE